MYDLSWKAANTTADMTTNWKTKTSQKQKNPTGEFLNSQRTEQQGAQEEGKTLKYSWKLNSTAVSGDI